MDMSLNEFQTLTSTCWKEKDQPFTNVMTKNKFTGRYRVGLISIFVPNSSLFRKYYTEFIFDDNFNCINEYLF